MSEITTTAAGRESAGDGLVLARRRVTAARDRDAAAESDGGGTGRSDGND
ncbi:MAG TPA: hypothetical protein VK545_02300 [Streptomyces sp.]|nr:hypothetical protein [Streptomyces sp.]